LIFFAHSLQGNGRAPLLEEFILTRRTVLLLFSFVAFSLAAFPLAGQAEQKPLTVEAIFAHGSLIGHPPDEVTWSPDAKHLTYMDADALMDMDPGTGKAHLLVSRAALASMTEGPDTETDRDHRTRYKQPSYQWSPDSAHLLFDRNGRLWLYDLRTGTSVEVGSTGSASGDDPSFSPDGESIAFLRQHGLAVMRLKEPSRPVTMVAPAPNANTLNGEVDWIYLEELEARSNYSWSPDSKNLAYLEMNEAAVPQYPITDWIPTHAREEMQRYPQPGDPNPAVRVGVVSAGGGKTAWVTLPIRAGEDYIPRFGWVDAGTLWIETLTRDQKHRDLYFADARTGESHAVLRLEDDKFFDEQYDVFVGDGSIVLTNWADGHSHLYLYSYDQTAPAHATAKLERQLTQGDFEVSDVLRVDTTGKFVDYASDESIALGEQVWQEWHPAELSVKDLIKSGEPEQQLWQVSFAGYRKPLSANLGSSHEGNFAPVGTAFVDKQSSMMTPPSLWLCTEAEKCSVFWKAPSLKSYRLYPPLPLKVKAHDGTMLDATLLLPEGKNAASVPLIVNPYGGPGEPTVVNKWSNEQLFDELLAQHGFAVLHTDNRGMGGRGRAFAQAAYHDLGPVQLEDQLTVVDAALAKYPQLDSKRLGWWGWSWGGTFTLYAMSHSDRFRAGVSVAPVTDWRDYDSIYTERYMSEPAEFASGYKDFSVVNSVASLKGRVLLAHGTGDDNVHIENTVQYVQKLIEAGIPYDLQLYPRKTHSIAGAEARTHLYTRILAHFEQYLKSGQ
jgi:dipeptidyl-peptidase-4